MKPGKPVFEEIESVDRGWDINIDPSIFRWIQDQVGRRIEAALDLPVVHVLHENMIMEIGHEDW